MLRAGLGSRLRALDNEGLGSGIFLIGNVNERVCIGLSFPGLTKVEACFPATGLGSRVLVLGVVLE